jgi:hypothetical protein
MTYPDTFFKNDLLYFWPSTIWSPLPFALAKRHASMFIKLVCSCAAHKVSKGSKKKELSAVDTPIVFVDAHIFPHSIGNAISVFRVK